MTTRTFTAIKLALFFVIVLMVGASASAQSCVLPPNTTMVAWYSFDEQSPLTTSTDLAAGNTGTQVNGPLGISSGEVAGAASFNGTNQFIQAASSIDINFGPAGTTTTCTGPSYSGSGGYSSCLGNFSIDTWVNVPATAPSGVMAIVDKRSDSPLLGYHFFVYEDATGNQYLGLQLADPSGYANYGSAVVPLYDGTWHHIAVTVNRTAANGITFYLDGVPVGNSTAGQLGSLVNSSPLRIGTRTASSPLTGWFLGSLDELEIYNRDLTAAEVFAIFNAQSAGKCKPPTPGPLASCIPSGAFGLLIQKPNVTAYVAQAQWSGNGTLGVQVVPIEPIPVAKPVPISPVPPNPVDSCAANSVTGEAVCVANLNSTDVYLITGSTLNSTLTSGATGYASFSGGGCYNCGEAIDAVRNQAVLEIGLSGSPSGSGIQVLDLSTNTFQTPLALNNTVSENIQIDPFLDLIFSPSENTLTNGPNVYDLITRNETNPKEYSQTISPGSQFDSAAEDCTTGIALSTVEETGYLYISDVTQAKFSGTSWTAPGQLVNFPEFNNRNNWYNGTCGISVAPESHLAVVTSEGAGGGVGVVVLPSSSGSGTPSFGDYAAAVMPDTPDGNTFNIAADPHAVGAYVSPNDGRAYGVLGEGQNGSYLGVVDLQKLLAAPRLLGTHQVDPTYNLLQNGVVRYVSEF